MNYRYLSPNNYEVTLTVYRDCYNGIPPFDDPAAVGIFDKRGDLIRTYYPHPTGIHNIPNAINSPCLTPPVNVCYQVAKYIFQITVPPGMGPYTITYQRCCRNYTINNIENVQEAGATYVATIPDPSVVAIDNNPVFRQLPPTFICRSAPFTFDHSATDSDGDSLVYEVSNPLDGGSRISPIPDPPEPPPYGYIGFLPPYSVNNVFGGLPLTINHQTGFIKATPNNEGQYVYCIVVKEYRNGVLIGETRRDFQVNIITCPDLTVASIYSPTIACGNLTAEFVNNSYGSTQFQWDFGDTSTFSDTSTIKNPSYDYPDTGTYYATLIAYSPFNSLCNDTVEGLVHVYPEFFSDFIFTNYHCSGLYSFSDASYGIHGEANYWTWNFGDNTRPSFQENPIHSYTAPGEYTVTLTSSVDSACLDTIQKSVRVLRNPVADFSISLDTCNFQLRTNNVSQFSVNQRWDFGDNTTIYSRDAEHKFLHPGEYDVRLYVVSDSSCVDTTTIHVSIPPLPVPDFSFLTQPCDSNVQFVNLSANAEKYIWSFGDNDFSFEDEPFHSYSKTGWLNVKLTAISEHKCKAVAEKSMYIVSHKKAFFKAVTDSCKGLVNFINVTDGATNYHWDFGDGTVSTEQYPAHKYEKEGEYVIKLSVNNETECGEFETQKHTYEDPLGEKLFIPNTFTPNGDGHNDFFEISSFRPCDIYKLTIINRWGQEVFQTEDAYNTKWDGSFGGEKLAADVYVYILEDGDNRRTGLITILR